ncbi:Uncharacterised protein [Salmonella bongori]|nr:Uncharacterised protein [Salmonella bongori]
MVRRLLVRLSPKVTGAVSAGVTFFVGYVVCAGAQFVVKLRRFARIIAGEDQCFRPFTDIQRITVTNVITQAVNNDRACTANINDA